MANDINSRFGVKPFTGNNIGAESINVGNISPTGDTSGESEYLGIRTGGTKSSSSGFGRLTGHQGTSSSEVGFSLLEKWHQLSRQGKKILIGSLIGFALLLPPITGQLMHPGAPKGTSSPVAMMVEERSQLPGGQEIRGKVDQSRARIPGGVGSPREDGIRHLIGVHDDAVVVMRKSDQLSSQAQRLMEQLKGEVGLDARMGYGVDWYWFGVPPNHANFHAGTSDTQGLEQSATGVREAVSYARTTAREEVSRLLIAESPEYAQLHANYTHEHNRLTAAQDIRKLADDAVDALTTAQHAITMRNITPRTVEEDVYETRTNTTRNSDGTTSSTTERVKTGTRTVDNPDWHFWNTAAIVAKANAEGHVRELNQAVKDHRALLGINGQNVDANLITAWDFFGQPSFLIWSFDSQDVSRTKGQAESLRGYMDGLVDQIKPVHDRLEGQVNAAIDARWRDIKGDGPQQNGDRKDDVALRGQRTSRRRSEDDDGGDSNFGV